MPHFIYRTLFYCFSRPCYNDDAGLSLAGEGPRQQSARKEPTPPAGKPRAAVSLSGSKKKEDPMKNHFVPYWPFSLRPQCCAASPWRIPVPSPAPASPLPVCPMRITMSPCWPRWMPMAPTGSISRAARSPVMYWSRASRTPPTPHGRNSWTTRTPTATTFGGSVRAVPRR